MENAALGTEVGRVQAIDRDLGLNAVFEYAITHANIGKLKKIYTDRHLKINTAKSAVFFLSISVLICEGQIYATDNVIERWRNVLS